jgi:hypothetical protein
MEHETVFTKGTDARNHTCKCRCGWTRSGTHKDVREWALVHKRIFANEPREWNDPKRFYKMPMGLGSC